MELEIIMLNELKLRETNIACIICEIELQAYVHVCVHVGALGKQKWRER